ncbi:MAG: nucleic acid-binding protein [Acidobacteria bacterium RIFCSPLOWO2_02_FULL_65_29]|nr:MAG: nucleic acid-binding protein [Acidobacteria bacterium RIFCSPLOWO2_02_FULL_65_29]
MSRLIVLDTGVLGMIVHPSATGEPRECKKWLETILLQGMPVYIPEVADYELRRELVRIKSAKSIARLDELKTTLGYVAITTPAMLVAAELWAGARNAGTPTADDRELDVDVILAAQSTILARLGDQVIVATTNVGHLSLFMDARAWRDIP